MAIRIKTIRKRRYAYYQYSYRQGGKVKTVSEYLGTAAAWGFILVGHLLRKSIDETYDRKHTPRQSRHIPVDPRTFVQLTPKEQKLELMKGRWQREDDEKRAEARRYSSPKAKAYKAMARETEKKETQDRNQRTAQALQEFNSRTEQTSSAPAPSSAEQAPPDAPSPDAASSSDGAN